MAKRRQPDIKFRVIITGPDGTRGDTVFAQSYAEVRLYINSWVLGAGEQIENLYIDTR